MSLSQHEPVVGHLSDDDYELVPCPSLRSEGHDRTTFDVMSLDDYACSSLDSGSESDPESPSRTASAVIEALEDLQCDPLSRDVFFRALTAAQEPMPAAAPMLGIPAPCSTLQAADAAESPAGLQDSLDTTLCSPTSSAADVLSGSRELVPNESTTPSPAAPAAPACRPASRRFALLLLVGAYATAVTVFVLLGSGTVPSKLATWSPDSHAGRPHVRPHHDAVLHHVLGPAAMGWSNHASGHRNVSASMSKSSTRSHSLKGKQDVDVVTVNISNMRTASTAAALLHARHDCWAGDQGLYIGPPSNSRIEKSPACKSLDGPMSRMSQAAQPKRPNPMLSCPVCWERVVHGSAGAPMLWHDHVHRPFTVLSALMGSLQQPARCQNPGNATAAEPTAASTARDLAAVYASPTASPLGHTDNKSAATAEFRSPQQSVSAMKQRRQQLSGYRHWVRQQQHQALKHLLQLYPALPAATGVAVYKPLPWINHHLQQQQQQQRQKEPAWAPSNSTDVNRLPAANNTTYSSIAPGKPGGVAAAAAAAVAAVVRRITHPTKPVPALYVPAPPCLMVTADEAAAATGKDASITGSRSKLSTAASNSPEANSSPLGLSSGSSAAGGMLTLPMLPPLTYAAVPTVKDIDASAVRQSTIAPAAAGGAAAGVTLPMLPPVCKNQQQVWQQGSVTCGSSGSEGGLTLPMLPPVTCDVCSTELQLLGHRPTVATAARQPNSQQVIALQPGATATQQQQSIVSFSALSSSPSVVIYQLPESVKVAGTGSKSNITDAGSSSNHSSAGSITGSGWVSTWASLPMLPPNDKLVADERPSQQSVSSPATAAAPISAAVLLTPEQTATAHAAAKAPQIAQPAEATAAGNSAAKHASHASPKYKLRRSVGQMQQSINTLLQLLAVAKERSLQCNLPVSTAPNTQQTPYSGSRSGVPAAVAINDAMKAAAKLSSLTNKLYVAGQRSAQASYRHVQYKSKSQHQAVQQLCMDVGRAHQSLQVKLAAAIYKPVPPSAAVVPAGNYVKHAAAGCMQQYHNDGYLKYLPSAAVQPSKKGAFVGSAVEFGSIMPWQQQLAAANHATITADRGQRSAAARGGDTGYQAKSKPAAGRYRAHTHEVHAHSSLPALNLGWDDSSAVAAAAAAGELYRVERGLQKACHKLALVSDAGRRDNADGKAARRPAKATGVGTVDARHVRLFMHA